MIYLDYAASCPMFPEAVEACVETWKNPSNMQSAHMGGAEHTLLEERLKQAIVDVFKGRVGVSDITTEHVVLTPSGSTANQWCVDLLGSNISNNLVVLPFWSHESMYKRTMTAAKVFKLSEESCDDDWILTNKVVKTIEQMPHLYIHTSVSNIDGREVPFPETNGFIHVDHVQGFMKTELPTDIEIETVSISAHKIGGPQGIGAIICRKLATAKALKGVFKHGTRNAGLIGGFLAAIQNWEKYQDIEKYEKFYMKLYAEEFKNNGKWRILSQRSRTPNSTICLLACKKHNAELEGINSTLWHLDQNGIMASETSACATEKNEELLKFFKIDEKEEELIRLSWGHLTEEHEIDTFINIMENE